MSKIDDIAMLFAKLNIAIEDAIKDGVITREAASDAAIFLVSCVQDGIAKSEYLKEDLNEPDPIPKFNPKLH